MKRGYDVKLRKCEFKSVVEQGKSRGEVSEIFQVPYETVRNWIKVYKKTGKLTSQVSKEVNP